MKNILLLVHEDAGQESRFQAALDLVRSLEGHLICLDVESMPLMMGDFYSVSVEAAVFAEQQGDRARNRERLEARLAVEGVPWTWVERVGSPAETVNRNAELADVIVVSRRLDSDFLPDTRGIASEVVIGSGRTVVAVPDRTAGFAAAGHAMVAWDGSEEAMNALRASVPLLALARIVTLVRVRDGSSGIAAQEAAAYLSRHGIKAVIVKRAGGTVPTADVLIAEAKAERADYIVMGAFGRSRIAEAVFGGVSRAMLTESPIPVVMTH